MLLVRLLVLLYGWTVRFDYSIIILRIVVWLGFQSSSRVVDGRGDEGNSKSPMREDEGRLSGQFDGDSPVLLRYGVCMVYQFEETYTPYIVAVADGMLRRKS